MIASDGVRITVDLNGILQATALHVHWTNNISAKQLYKPESMSLSNQNPSSSSFSFLVADFYQSVNFAVLTTCCRQSRLEIEARFQWSTCRKWHLANRIVKRSMTSRDPLRTGGVAHAWRRLGCATLSSNILTILLFTYCVQGQFNCKVTNDKGLGYTLWLPHSQ